MASEQAEAVDLVASDTVKQLSGAVLFAALTAVLAQFSIQLPGGVPFSFQPFGVFFAALVLGPLWGGFSIVLYVLVGLAGAPVFSTGGAGVGYVLGPTGGFLIGFVIAAAVIGVVAHRSLTPVSVGELSPVSATAALLAGLAVIYLVGIPWLAEVQGITLGAAASAMSLFVVGDLIKIGLTVGIVAGGNELLADW
jgi:Uncharacterized conserved protein